MEKFHEGRMLHTQFLTISLHQIDAKILEDLNRIVSKDNGIKCFYFNNNDNIEREGIIRSLMIKDKEALIITSIQDEIIKDFSEIKIEVGFDFLQKPLKNH